MIRAPLFPPRVAKDSLTEALVSKRLYFLLVCKVVCATQGETHQTRSGTSEFMQLMKSVCDLKQLRTLGGCVCMCVPVFVC